MVGKDLHNIFGTMHKKNINEDMQTYETMNSFCSAFRSHVLAVLAAGHEYASAQRPPRELQPAINRVDTREEFCRRRKLFYTIQSIINIANPRKTAKPMMS